MCESVFGDVLVFGDLACGCAGTGAHLESNKTIRRNLQKLTKIATYQIYSSSNQNSKTKVHYNKTQSSENIDYQSTSSEQETTLYLTYSEGFHGTQKRLNLGNKIISVRIPSGAKDGSRIKIKRKNTKNLHREYDENFYLNIQLTPHSFFSFESGSLACEIPITFDEAVLGTTIDVPTPDGMVAVKIPAGIQNGTLLRLRG